MKDSKCFILDQRSPAESDANRPEAMGPDASSDLHVGGGDRPMARPRRRTWSISIFIWAAIAITAFGLKWAGMIGMIMEPTEEELMEGAIDYHALQRERENERRAREWQRAQSHRDRQPPHKPRVPGVPIIIPAPTSQNGQSPKPLETAKLKGAKKAVEERAEPRVDFKALNP